MAPDPSRGYRLRQAFIRTPLRHILDPPQSMVQILRRMHGTISHDKAYSKNYYSLYGMYKENVKLYDNGREIRKAWLSIQQR